MIRFTRQWGEKALKSKIEKGSSLYLAEYRNNSKNNFKIHIYSFLIKYFDNIKFKKIIDSIEESIYSIKYISNILDKLDTEQVKNIIHENIKYKLDVIL